MVNTSCHRTSFQRVAAAGILAAATCRTAVARAEETLPPKRGLTYIGDADSHTADYNILLSDNSPLTWYYTWSPIPASSEILPAGAESRIEFVPTLPSTENLDENIAALDSAKSKQHLFTFNEPDGSTDSGGSSIEPADAAKAYVEKIAPLRDRGFRISHPSVTGSGRGLEWLDAFNASCWEVDAENGCPTDFVTAHWYGEFDGLVAWLDQLHGWYNRSGSGIVNVDEKNVTLSIWINELGLPQVDEDTAFDMMNRTLPFLDQLEYVEKYAWFGAFRPKEANSWTGGGLALFQNDGGLSKLGAYYLGGDMNGFKVGQQGQSSGGTGNNGAGNNGTDTGDGDGGDGDGDNDTNSATGLRASILALFFTIAAVLI